MRFDTRREFSLSMDEADPLRAWRAEFNFPRARNGYSPIYLCGNSLGLQPKLAVRYVQQELDDWGSLAVDGHLQARRPWLSYHRLAAAGLAELSGARDNEVVAMNALTVNLHLMMATFYRPTAARHKILIEATAFPSDRFAAMSQIRLHGFDPEEALIEWAPRGGTAELCINELADLLDAAGDGIALLLLPGVQYLNGQVLDLERICLLARQKSCAVGLDLAHAIGNVPLRLHDWAPDFAVWCSYKYLNSGPGAVGGAFVHSRHLDADGSGQLLGWWGHAEETRFRMAPTFEPAQGADLWQLSNPPILSLAPLLASLRIFGDAGLADLRRKSTVLTGYLEYLLGQRTAGRIASITPPEARGCQLSLVVKEPGLDARTVFGGLEAQNVIVDWREPDVIRVAPVPLYNSYEDVFEFVERLCAALDGNSGTA